MLEIDSRPAHATFTFMPVLLDRVTMGLENGSLFLREAAKNKINNGRLLYYLTRPGHIDLLDQNDQNWSLFGIKKWYVSNRFDNILDGTHILSLQRLSKKLFTKRFLVNKNAFVNTHYNAI